MKKLTISVLLLLLCNNAMSADTKSDWRSFGSKPEEDEFLLGLEEEIQWYFEPEQLDSCVEDDLVGCVIDTILVYKDGWSENEHIHLPLFIPPEIYEFLNELLDNVNKLESSYFKLKSDEQARKELINGWSAHTLLEKWKQEREANGGLRVEKPVRYNYKCCIVQK